MAKPRKEPEVTAKQPTPISTQVMRDSVIPFPEIWAEVYVSEGLSPQFAEFFARGRCRKAKNPEDADVVVFTGGADVDPKLYGQTPHLFTNTDENRDQRDIALYKECLDLGVPMLGICRGAQFLHVMNGGLLYQHVDGHLGDHPMWDTREREFIPTVSSTHHQMVMKNNKMEVLAEAFKSKARYISPTTLENGAKSDVEAFFYRDTCCLGIQGHPEYRGYHRYSAWCMKQMEHYFANNPDIATVKGQWRLKKVVKLDELEGK